MKKNLIWQFYLIYPKISEVILIEINEYCMIFKYSIVFKRNPVCENFETGN